ncbi:hypothetical protein HY636_00995 [Candidatus Woesearchaeota archaeon]|nr:hypothetical protein [Candidatus Woesearchaeota archaeon]
MKGKLFNYKLFISNMHVKNIYLYLLLIFIIIKILVFTTAFIGYNTIPFNQNMYNNNFKFFDKQETFSGIWQPWDSQWYMKIARDGYFAGKIGDLSDKAVFAFFPLYPLLIYLFNFGFNNLILSGLIVSFLCSIISVIYLYKLVLLDYSNPQNLYTSKQISYASEQTSYTSKQTSSSNCVQPEQEGFAERFAAGIIAKRTVFLFLLFPTAFFFTAVYTESLFIMLVILSFYYARQQKWFLASIFGILCSLTRSLGMFIVIPLLIEYLQNKGSKGLMIKFDKSIIWPLIIPLGLLIYQLYLWFITGTFSTFFTAQKFWSRGVFEVSNYIPYFTNPTLHGFRNSIIDVAATFFFIIMLYYIYKHLRLSYFVYSLLIILIPLLSGNLMSMTRMIIVSFPLYIILALLTREKPVLFYVLASLFFIIQLITSSLFVANYWIA